MDDKETQRDIFIRNYMREDFVAHCQHIEQCEAQDRKVGMMRSSCGTCGLNTRISYQEAIAALNRLEKRDEA